MAGTDTTETRTPLNSFILTEEGTNMFPWATELASQYSATPSELANGQNTILTNGETYFPPEAVEEIGVDTLNYMNNKPREGGHAAIDRVIAMTTLQGLRPMNEGGEVMPNYAGGGMVQDQMPGYRYGGMTKKKKMMGYENGGMSGYREGGKVAKNVFRGIGQNFDRADLDMNDDMYTMRRVLSVPAEQVGEGSGLRYYAGEATADMMEPLKSMTFMDAASKMNISPQDSIPVAMIDQYLSPKKKKGLMGLLGFQDGGMVDDSLTGMMGGGMAMKKNMMGMQDGGMVDYQNGGEVSDSLYWANHPANNPEMNGGSLGVVREQATMLQDSMKVDTANKAKKALQLLKLKGLLEEGEAIEYQNPQRMMNPNMIPTPDEAEMMQNMMRRLSI